MPDLLRAQRNAAGAAGNDIEQQPGNRQRMLRQARRAAYEPPAPTAALGALSSAQISGASGLSFPILTCRQTACQQTLPSDVSTQCVPQHVVFAFDLHSF